MMSKLSNLTNITELADRYYKAKGIEYTRIQARKQFYQQKNKDLALIQALQNEINSEALSVIASLK